MGEGVWEVQGCDCELSDKLLMQSTCLAMPSLCKQLRHFGLVTHIVANWALCFFSCQICLRSHRLFVFFDFSQILPDTDFSAYYFIKSYF